MGAQLEIRKIQVHRILAGFTLFTPIAILFFIENSL
jgi:hypothetical protein